MDTNLKQLEEHKSQLEALKESYAAIENGFKELVKPKTEIKADGMKDGPTTQDCMNYIESQSRYFWQAISNLQQSIYSASDNFYTTMSKHCDGHLPSIKSASQMEAALSKLGIADDYQVYKPTLYVSSAKTLRGSVITISNKNGKTV